MIALISLVAYIILQVKACNDNAYEAATWKARYDTATATIRTLKNRTGQAVTEQKAAVFASARDVQAASAKGFNLTKKKERKIKQVALYAEVEQAVKLSDTIVPHPPTPSLIGVGKAVDSVAVPLLFEKRSDRYSIAGQVTKEAVIIDSLSIYNTVRLRLAERRAGLFRPNETVVQVMNSNPLVVTTGMKTLTIKHKPNAWNKWMKPVAFAAAGVIIGRAGKK